MTEYQMRLQLAKQSLIETLVNTLMQEDGEGNMIGPKYILVRRPELTQPTVEADYPDEQYTEVSSQLFCFNKQFNGNGDLIWHSRGVGGLQCCDDQLDSDAQVLREYGAEVLQFPFQWREKYSGDNNLASDLDGALYDEPSVPQIEQKEVDPENINYTIDFFKVWVRTHWPKDFKPLKKMRMSIHLDGEKYGMEVVRREPEEEYKNHPAALANLLGEFLDQCSKMFIGSCNTIGMHISNGKHFDGAKFHAWDNDGNETVWAFGAGMKYYTMEATTGKGLTMIPQGDGSCIYHFAGGSGMLV